MKRTLAAFAAVIVLAAVPTAAQAVKGGSGPSAAVASARAVYASMSATSIAQTDTPAPHTVAAARSAYVAWGMAVNMHHFSSACLLMTPHLQNAEMLITHTPTCLTALVKLNGSHARLSYSESAQVMAILALQKMTLKGNTVSIADSNVRLTYTAGHWLLGRLNNT